MSNQHKIPDKDEVNFSPPQTIHLTDFECQEGWILDIGGGGEGIIGLLKGRQVVAIDLRKSELEETTNDALKIVMDACDLKFLDNSFQSVTAFFTLMYIPWEDIETVFAEISRVLKLGGEFLIWDVTIQVSPNNNKPYFFLPLTVILPNGKKVETVYGVHNRQQTLDDFVKIYEKYGFKLIEQKVNDKIFYIRLKK